MSQRHSAPAPVIWRCPECNGTATSNYGRKTHVCPPPKAEPAPGMRVFR